jgi:hypothetical protein
MKVRRDLQTALEENDRRRLLPRFREEVARDLDQPAESIRITNLAEMRPVWEAFVKSSGASLRGEVASVDRTWPTEDLASVEAYLRGVEATAADIPMYLFRALSPRCGAVLASSKEILRRALDLVSLDQEDLMASSEDAAQGIILIHRSEPGGTGNSTVYELQIWGDALLSEGQTP